MSDKITTSDLAGIVLANYPDVDLCPINPNARTLEALKRDSPNWGDTLLSFIVTELIEGGNGTVEGAARLLNTAQNQIQAVIDGLAAHQENASRQPIHKG